MISQDMRRKFLQYFQSKGHSIVPSSSVVPHDDPTLLFTNAGMNQFKDIFLGKAERDYKRATTSQKCIRVGGKHNDLDNVGHTSRHLTFFEMLGNFSFGDYFKKEAIEYAWEMCTNVFEFDEEKVWVSVFETDEEAYELWSKIVPQKRIVRLGEKDNFWSMGDTGPCGPCSELLYDRGSDWGVAKSPLEDPSGERFFEFWNLVFMQYNKDSSGKMDTLPKQSIDTGAGLERVVSLKMGVNTVFATDIFLSLIAAIENLTGVAYNSASAQAPAFHVIADHLRSLSFAIADGAQPSNVDRGYVLRKLLRRAVRYGKNLGIQEPFLAKLLPRLIEIMGSDYKELGHSKGRIEDILNTEEEAFLRTLKRGGNILGSIIEKAKASSNQEITAEEAFKLKDTYGFPIEEILLIAKDTSLQVNLEAYELLEQKAKELSRASQTVHEQKVEDSLYKKLAHKIGKTQFCGFTDMTAETTLLAIITDAKETTLLEEGSEAILILETTPFYAEKGGQVGDTGVISHKGATFIVHSVKEPYPGIIAHSGILITGVLAEGEPVVAKIEEKRRENIARHHSATHLLHYALQQVLGEHIKQAGSLVETDRLRFDFNHHKPLSAEELRTVERLVNEKIRSGTPICTYELPYEEVQSKGEIKQFFGDKYGATVRVVDIDYSKELCGGTHIDNTGKLGFFRIFKESSIAAGVRRIEAFCGLEAEKLTYHEADSFQKVASLLKTTEELALEKLGNLLEENKKLSLELKNYKRASIKALADELFAKARTFGSSILIATKVDVDAEFLPLLFDELQKKSASHVIVLGSVMADRCQIAARLSADLVKKGLHAGKIIQEIAPYIDGSGGGKDLSAQAGGKNAQGLSQALSHAETLITKQL